MLRQPFKQMSMRSRLLVAALSAASTLCLLHRSAVARAQEVSDATKKAEAEEEPPKIPPPLKPADDDWLTMPMFDRLRLSLGNEEFPERSTLVRKNDKNLDGKLSPDEWPSTLAYAFESFDWNSDHLLEEKELIGVIVDTELLEGERPLPRPPPGAPPDAKMQVTLATGEHAVVNFLRSRLVEVKYFEDMLMEQGRKALSNDDLDKAFEYINFVAERQPEWQGLDKIVVDFWLKEAEYKLRRAEQVEDERAIDLLHQLHDYCVAKNLAEPADARRTMGVALKRIVERAFEKQQYMLARHRLYTLLKDYPDLQLGAQLRNEFIRRAEAMRAEAKQRESAGDLRSASFAILEAADIWPKLPGMEQDFDRIYRKYPILHVAVRELPERFSPWPPPATPDARVAQLIHLPLMEVAGVGENTKYSSRILDYFELSEQGRRIRLRVKPGLVWSDGEKPITAHDLSRSITTRKDKRIPNFDAALASVIKEMRANSVDELEVDLRRTPLRHQSNFLFNLAAGHRLQADRLDQNAAVGAGPFRAAGKKTGVEAYLQANKHYFGGTPRIAEIVERRYLTGKDSVRALLAGDVSLLEHVPHKELRRIEARSEDIAIARDAVPALHVISFDFRSRTELHNWTLRRAMVYAIDRQAILEGALLEGPSGEIGELVHGAFPKGSFAFEASLESWPYDPVLAKGLVDAAKKELRVQSLRFSLFHPDIEQVATACAFIKEYWKMVGIELDLRPLPTQQLEEEVVRGRRFDLVYRIHYVRDPVLDAARVLCLGPPIAPDGAVMPNAASPWLRQNLRDLEFATAWPVAKEKLSLIQLQARDDVALIPLWQLTEYYAYHKRLQGVLDNSIGMYQDAEKWQIEPWYRKDPD